MHFPSLLPILASLTLVTGTCFDEGPNGGGITGWAYANTTQIACPHLTGVYGDNQQLHFCVNDLTPNFRWDFYIRHLISSQAPMTIEYCEDKLKTEIGGCPKGGRRSYADFEFT